MSASLPGVNVTVAETIACPPLMLTDADSPLTAEVASIEMAAFSRIHKTASTARTC